MNTRRQQYAAATELDRLVEARLLTRGQAAEIRHMHEMRHRVMGAGRARAALLHDASARTPTAEEEARTQANYAGIQRAMRRLTGDEAAALRRFVEDFETMRLGATTGFQVRALRSALEKVRALYTPETD